MMGTFLRLNLNLAALCIHMHLMMNRNGKTLPFAQSDCPGSVHCLLVTGSSFSKADEALLFLHLPPVLSLLVSAMFQQPVNRRQTNYAVTL